MSKVWFISDLHLDHKSIHHFCPDRGGEDLEGHNLWVIERLNLALCKRDTLWILGDVSFSLDGLRYLSLLNCQYIKFVLGNHDRFDIQVYLKYGRVYPGLTRYKQMWLSHCPIHPLELRGMRNVHGHVHHSKLEDDRYIHVGVDARHGLPTGLEELRPV